MREQGLPQQQGLYSPNFEHDACGIGMLVNVQGNKSHKIVTDAINILQNLTHRGGVGSEPDTGDGAGILLQIPHEFMQRVAANGGITLPASGEYGIAMLFASPDSGRCAQTLNEFCAIVKREGLQVLGTRIVPTYKGCIGKTAAEVCPAIHQIFIARPTSLDENAFERKLYVISKLTAAEIRYNSEDPDLYFYLASISARTIVYKGMLLPYQLADFYLDLKDEDMASAIALVHSRFSTNTFPSWERAHPMHHIIHNGEINTIRGNVNWVKAREAMLQSELFGDDLQRVFPVINEDGSDSAMLDDFLKLLIHAGYSLPQAMMMAIPEPWEHNPDMDADKHAFYEYNSCLLEPWDGPAAVAFTDGQLVGATLDRNGLRPARYYLTRDNTLILASEVGVLPVNEADIVLKARLQPGRMLLIDTASGKIIEDAQLKKQASTALPYKEWLAKNLLHLDTMPETSGAGESWRDIIEEKKQRGAAEPHEQALLKDFVGLELLMAGNECAEAETLSEIQRQKMFGYSWEDIDLTLKAMAVNGDDPVGAMGYDSPLAVLSNKPQLLYSYFKQLFAQVTNPPIDAIREYVVTSSMVQFGSESNLLQPGPENCRMVHHNSPVLSEIDMQKLRTLRLDGLRSVTLPMLFNARQKNSLPSALEDLFFAADVAMDSGYNILILSDRGACEGRVPIPALLACAGLHHHLISKGNRTRVSIVVETGEAREVHHLACLIGYGANAVHPFMAYRIIQNMADAGHIQISGEAAKANYCKAATKSIVKVMSKMGISTVRSYHGAQIFEALGVSQAVVDKFFTGTTTRIGGITLKEIEQEARARYEDAFNSVTKDNALDAGGYYKWRKNGEYHLYNPENIFYLQQACRTGNYSLFKRFSSCVNQRSVELKNIRGLLSIVTADKPIPLETVEPAESIVRRFKTGAMSYGSISREAHECMAIAMNRLHGKSNSGEGGEIPERFVPDANGDSRSSAIKQVASGRFGVTIHYLNNAVEIQIKMAQGAKPGEGGHLPGKKVYPWIAKARYSTPGVELISPPPHHDIYSIEDLAQLIHDLKNANRDARISVKLVSEAGVGTIAVGVAKGLADVIVVSGYDGGTGAAPRTSIRHAGLPWELGLAEAHQTLLMNNMRNRVVLETDGKLLTGRDVVIAALLGAEEFAFATAPLVVMGCDMMRVCNLDTCPVGIATQNPELRAKFGGKPEYIENLMLFLAEEVREWMARIGVRSFTDLIGHVELLHQKTTDLNPKAQTVDLSALLYQPKAVNKATERYFTHPQNHALENTLDMNTLLPLCQSAISSNIPVKYRLPINNTQRTVGCLLSSEIVRTHGSQGLPAGSIQLRFDGSAGQSFGAFLAAGVELQLHGDANDYIGKGLSGGRIVVMPPQGSSYVPEQNIIVGNVAFYGATSGEAYIRGMAGERFCVRNSGVSTVVEGVGDHACEYMTGGCVLVLGDAGRNFAAGMSGGIAYVYDAAGDFAQRCNTSMASLTTLSAEDCETVKTMLQNHAAYTGSTKAQHIVKHFKTESKNFIKIIPNDYSRVLKALAEADRQKLDEDGRMLYAFDTVVGGNK